VALGLLSLVFLQMATGALVAGLDAGRTYNDWPLMAGELLPTHYIQADLGIRSLFEGRAATQFNHRFLAYLLWGVSLWAAWRYRSTALAQPFGVLAALVSAQAGWGILTLLNAAPLTLALVHQGLGVIVTLAAVCLAWSASGPVTRPPAPA
jgi:cytochrome c oxidase assembly protein subunit 15